MLQVNYRRQPPGEPAEPQHHEVAYAMPEHHIATPRPFTPDADADADTDHADRERTQQQRIKNARPPIGQHHPSPALESIIRLSALIPHAAAITSSTAAPISTPTC